MNIMFVETRVFTKRLAGMGLEEELKGLIRRLGASTREPVDCESCEFRIGDAPKGSAGDLGFTISGFRTNSWSTSCSCTEGTSRTR